MDDQTLRNIANHVANWVALHLVSQEKISLETAEEIAKQVGDAAAQATERAFKEHRGLRG